MHSTMTPQQLCHKSFNGKEHLSVYRILLLQNILYKRIKTLLFNIS
jgi:hypothetical protein